VEVQWAYQEQMVFLANVIPKIKKITVHDVRLLFKLVMRIFLIDTSPDLRKQLLDNKIIKIDKVLYSHMHADQTHGINDLRSIFY
jgi:phosphoribosyl 1,2-cyclic phosphate phosphodiesterase